MVGSGFPEYRCSNISHTQVVRQQSKSQIPSPMPFSKPKIAFRKHLQVQQQRKEIANTMKVIAKYAPVTALLIPSGRSISKSKSV